MLQTDNVGYYKITKKALYVIYILAFLTSFHLALTLYLESSFMEEVISKLGVDNIERYVGLVYTAASLITFVLFLNISKILRKIGNFRLAFYFILVEVLMLLGLTFTNTLSSIYIIFFFLIHIVAVSIIYFNLDLFLESFSDDKSTGTVRGIFLTTMNIAVVIAPFIAGLVLTDGDFWKIFLISAAIMSLALPLLFIQFNGYKDPIYDSVPFIETIKEIWRRKNIYKIMSSMFILRFFYSWMIIYTPIYLNQAMGLPFSQIIGIIMPIALLPFVFFQFIIGKIADSTLGEKELLTAGFIIAGFSTASLSFVTSPSIVVWAALLFITRIGASFVEMMVETYFYKKIDATDTHLIGYFKNMRPLAFLIAPLLATGFLIFFDYQYLFLVLGIIVFSGIYFSLTIKDTM